MIPNLNVGKESISQTISMLECWQLNHTHEYQAIPKTQTGLRLDAQVKTTERAKRHNEPKRVESLQALKATSSSSGEPVFMPVECRATLMTSPSSPSPPSSKTRTQRQSLSNVPPGACRHFQAHSMSMLGFVTWPCSSSQP